MIVYIEDVLLENFLITFLVLSVVYMLIGQKGSKIRHIFSSIFGALIALVYPLIYMSNILLILLKCGVGFIICLIAYREKTKKQLLFYTLFMLVTAVYGGVNLMISFCVYGSFDQGKLPTIIVLLLFILITYLLKQCQKVLYKKKNILNFVYDVVIKNDDVIIKTKAYFDTGNVLVDPESNRPVALMGYKLFEKLCKGFNVSNFLTKNTSGLKNGHYINVKTATGENSMLVFDVDFLEIKKAKESVQIQNPIFALSKVKITGFSCDVILNANFL